MQNKYNNTKNIKPVPKMSKQFVKIRIKSNLTNLIKIRSFDTLPQIATKGSNEILVQSCEYLINQKTAFALA